MKPIMELNDELGVMLGERKLRPLPVKDLDEGFPVLVWFPEEAYGPEDYQDYRAEHLV